MISPISKVPHVPSSLKRWASRSELAIIIADTSGAVQWVNEAFTHICDYQLDEIIGMKPGHFLSGPLTEVHARESLNASIRDKKPCLVRITNYKKNGTPYVVEIHLEPIFDRKTSTRAFFHWNAMSPRTSGSSANMESSMPPSTGSFSTVLRWSRPAQNPILDRDTP